MRKQVRGEFVTVKTPGCLTSVKTRYNSRSLSLWI